MTNFTPLHFYDHVIEVRFKMAPDHEKSPHCPDEFTWDKKVYPISKCLAEWSDFTRRGRAARNMRPSHAATAATRGSLGVGRFYFRVLVETGRIFDIYYDRALQDVDRRKGQWFIYRELTETG